MLKSIETPLDASNPPKPYDATASGAAVLCPDALSLRLAVIRMHGVCFEGVLRMLRDASSGAASELDLRDEACTAAAISKVGESGGG